MQKYLSSGVVGGGTETNADHGLPAIMIRKKKMMDEMGDAIQSLDTAISQGRSKLKELCENPDDRQKVANLGIQETLDASGSFAKEMRELRQRISDKQVACFPEDAAEIEQSTLAVLHREKEAKGCQEVLEQVRSDRKAEDKRQKSQAEYAVKKDVKKYLSKGVCRKLGMALVRIESSADTAVADLLDHTPFSAWKSAQVSVHGFADVEGLRSFCDLIRPIASEKQVALMSKLSAKDPELCGFGLSIL